MASAAAAGRCMLMVMRGLARLSLALVGSAVLLGACQPAAPPVAEKKSRRRSFEESSAWKPAAPAAQPGAGSTDAQAQKVQSTWEQARQATSDAERQRLAGEALEQTRAMAEQPAPSPQ